jgi:metallophosphoesterase (TIGR00282 family)
MSAEVEGAASTACSSFDICLAFVRIWWPRAMPLRALFIGDIVGQPGLALTLRAVPWLRRTEDLHLVAANAENACAGAGLAPSQYRRLRECGVDVITMGDHIYKKIELVELLSDPTEPICKPANYPPGSPGKDYVLTKTESGHAVAIISVMGRLFMRPVDCPYAALDRILAKLESMARCILVDVHAEATGDKALLARYLVGRVSAVLGTHTHVQTADETVFPAGTAFISDLGMTGPYESILGRRIDRVLHTSRTGLPTSFEVATADVRLAGAIIEIDETTGKALAIRRVMLKESDVPPAEPPV